MDQKLIDDLNSEGQRLNDECIRLHAFGEALEKVQDEVLIRTLDILYQITGDGDEVFFNEKHIKLRSKVLDNIEWIRLCKFHYEVCSKEYDRMSEQSDRLFEESGWFMGKEK